MRIRPRFHKDRLHAAAIIVAVFAAACGVGNATSADGPDDEPTESRVSAPAAAADLAIEAGVPTPVPSPQVVTAPEPQPTFEAPPPVQVADSVELKQPELLVTPPADSYATIFAALAVPEVDHISGAALFEATVLRDGVETPVTVLGIDQATFRPLTPEVTAQSAGVWQRIAEGDVAVRHAVAADVRADLGGNLQLRGPERTLSVRVGAFASNGAPPIADIVVPWDLANQLGAPDINLLIISVDEGADADDVGEEIIDAFGGGSFEVVTGPEERQAELSELTRRLDSFTYKDLGDGVIVIERAWVEKWIVTVDLPYLGRTRCNRLMVPQLVGALNEIGQVGLAGELDPNQFAGCWFPRHIDWDPRKPLSMHAFGLAVDINAQDNWLGAVPTMHPTIVEIFKRWGFDWGGDWRRPDGMHFELARIIEQG